MGAWSYQDLVGRIRHPDASVRRWAAERLRARFPIQAPEVLVECLEDSDRALAILAAGVLEEAADPRFGAALLARFERAEGLLAGRLAAALGAARYQPALPALLARLERQALAAESLRGICEALGAMGQGAALRATLERGVADPDATGMLAGALFQAGDDSAEGEVAWLAHALWNRFTPEQRAAAVEHIAARFGAGDLLHELRWAMRDGVGEAVDVAEAWILQQVDWESGRLHGLVPGWWDGPGRWFADVAREAGRLGGPPLARRAAALLDALAAAPPSKSPEEGLTDLSLALLCALAVSRDDAAALLEAEQDDDPGARGAAVMALLASRRERLWVDAVVQAAALGLPALPGLLELLDGDQSYWGAVRAARAIGRLARAEPGAGDSAVSSLFDAIRRDGTDALAEAAMWALIAIGRPSLAPIRRSLIGGSDGEQVMMEVLGEIADPDAPRILVDYAASVGFMDEMVVAALADSGSALAIEPLARAWEPGATELSEVLVLLCAINDLSHPQLARWRQDVSGGRRHQLRWSRELDAMLQERRLAEDQDAPEQVEAASPPPDVTEAVRRQRKAKRLARKKRRKKKGRR